LVLNAIEKRQPEEVTAGNGHAILTRVSCAFFLSRTIGFDFQIRRDPPQLAARGKIQVKEGTPMTITDGERLILMMLSEIHEHLRIEDGGDSQFVRSSIISGNVWGVKWRFPRIFHDSDPTPEVVTEVVDILNMWSAIEGSYQNVSPEDRAKIEKEAAPYGSHVRFSGFDGNNEAFFLSVARFLVDDLGRFQIFKGRDLDSHSPWCLDGYRRMLAVFKPLRASSHLIATDIIELLKARFQPEDEEVAAR
jgi:uncharacterized protein YfbU (UPF0304 family)